MRVWWCLVIVAATIAPVFFFVVDAFATPPAHATCSTPVTATLRGKAVQFDLCYDRSFTHDGTDYTVHVYYTETDTGPAADPTTNLGQCSAAENTANRCEHKLADNDNPSGDNINAVAMAAEAETAMRFYIDRNLNFIPSGETQLIIYIGEDPRSGGIIAPRAIYVDDEKIDNADGLWKRILAFHEIQHLVQNQYEGTVGWKSFYGEGISRTIEDRVDIPLDARTLKYFIPEVASFSATSTPRRSDIEGISYRSVLWWTWLLDQYRDLADVDPVIGWTALRDFYLELDSASDQLGAIADFISSEGSSFRKDFIDYTLAIWAYEYSPADPRLGFLDTEINATAGMSNHVTVTTGPPFGPTATDPTMNPRSSRHYEFNPANQCDYTAFAFDGEGNTYGFSVMTVDGGVLKNRWTSYSGEWARTVRSVDLDRVVGVITAFDQSGNVDISYGCVDPTLTIKQPTSAAIKMVGPADNPRNFIVRLTVEDSNGTSIAGLVSNAFNVTLTPTGGGGDMAASVISSAYVQDDYWLLVEPPSDADGAVSGSSYHLSVELDGNVDDTQNGSILYEDQTQDVIIVLDRSGSMGNGSGKIEAARNAANLMVNVLSDGDQGGYVAFDTDADLQIGLDSMAAANHRQDLEDAIAAEVDLSQTSVGDGMDTAADEHDAEGIDTNMCSFVLLSDGQENEPQEWPDVEADVTDNGCAIHVIGLGPGADETFLQGIMASVPGGTYDYATTQGGVPINSTLGWENNLSRVYDYKATQIAGRQRILSALADSAINGVSNGVIDFEDQNIGDQFVVSNTFVASGVKLTPKEYDRGDGVLFSDGSVSVDGQGVAGGTGLDLKLNLVNLEFGFGSQLDFLTMRFNSLEPGNHNIDINGDRRIYKDFSEINGQKIGGVNVTVGSGSKVKGSEAHSLTLKGPIDSFSIGGTALFIDTVQFTGEKGNAHLIPVDDATDVLVVSIAWQNGSGGGHSTNLMDPHGNPVDPGKRRTSSRNTNDVWEVPGPLAGNYKLLVKDLAQEYFVTASALSRYEIHLFIGAPIDRRSQGVQVPIVAALTAIDGPMIGATVTATVTDPNDTGRTMPLHDDGNHGDGEPGDGIYGNTHTATSLADAVQDPAQVQDGQEAQAVGSYRVEVRATWGEIMREAHGSFAIERGADNDFDGIPDLWEEENGLNPKSPEDAHTDPDRDGLTNTCEYRLGTNPLNSDTDGGGESDGSEVKPTNRAATVLATHFSPTIKLSDCVSRRTIQDPLDPSDDRVGPISSLIAVPEATVQGRPFINVLIGSPEKGVLTGWTLFRQAMTSNGELIEDWQVVASDLSGQQFTDAQITPWRNYRYLLEPRSDKGEGPIIIGRLVSSNMVHASTDPYPPSGDIQIADGAMTTPTTIVDLQLLADDMIRNSDRNQDNSPIPGTPIDQLKMRLSNSPDFEGAVTEPFNSLVQNWDLGPGQAEDVRTVYAQFIDSNGNVSDIVSDTVTVSPADLPVSPTQVAEAAPVPTSVSPTQVAEAAPVPTSVSPTQVAEAAPGPTSTPVPTAGGRCGGAPDGTVAAGHLGLLSLPLGLLVWRRLGRRREFLD